MSKALTDTEFYTQMCRWADSTSTQTAKKWMGAIFEVIVREVYYNGSCRIPGIGTITTREVEETYQKQTDPVTKEMVVYKVPARTVPLLAPSDEFIDDINMQGVTGTYRKKLKKNALTIRDYERQVRAESMKVDKFVPQAQVEEAQKEFKRLLKEKTQRQKKKLEKIEDDE